MRWLALIAGATLLGLLAVHFWPNKPSVPAPAPLSQQGYLWQRNWNSAVSGTVTRLAPHFDGFVVLAAEVRWVGSQSAPDIQLVHPDYAGLRASGRPVGLALRVGPYPFEKIEMQTGWLAGLAGRVAAEAHTNSLTVAELQIDFDCPVSKLGEFRQWLVDVRQALPNVPLTMTALPSWLGSPEFAGLIGAVDGYVLQVHSLVRPETLDQEVSLCDPEAARRAVARAASFGSPFRVALPTYGYLLAFSPSGQFVGLSAEGPALTWPGEVRLREIRSDPASIAALVAEWRQHHPTALRGILWYRLPVEGDRLNWNWVTLHSVMEGIPPREDLQVQILSTRDELFEIQLVNRGTADHDEPVQVTLSWQIGRVISTEALGGFELSETAPLSWRSPQSGWVLGAGQTQIIGWVRMKDAKAVTAKLERR